MFLLETKNYAEPSNGKPGNSETRMQKRYGQKLVGVIGSLLAQGYTAPFRLAMICGVESMGVGVWAIDGTSESVKVKASYSRFNRALMVPLHVLFVDAHGRAVHREITLQKD